MKLHFSSVPESGLDRVRAFLRAVFDAPESAAFLQSAHLRWKYWQPRPDWPGSRSHAYETDSGAMVAHACAWPFELRTSQGSLAGTNPIDWAGDLKVPGAGALLLREIRKLRDISCCVGGTDIARRAIIQSGFREISAMRYFVRPVRPFRNALTHQRRNWKLPARLIRNLIWQMEPRGAIPAGWSYVGVEPEQIPESLFPEASPGVAVAGRSSALFRYMLGCPAAPHRMWLASYRGSPRGYFMISLVPGQARLVDAWVIERSAGAWQAIFALAAAAATEYPSAAELLLATPLGEAAEGAIQAGFRPCFEIPIMMFDPRKSLEDSQIHLQMMDNDAGFLHEGRIDYMT